MGHYMVELYVERGVAVEPAVELTRGAATRLTGEGRPVRLVRSILVPADETCLLLFEAADADAAQEAAHAAGLPFERVATAVAEI
jgi:hypothetical protein